MPRSTLLFTAAVLLAPPARAQIPPDDRIRAEFLAWYKTFDRDEAVPVLLRSFQAHLVANGASPQDAAAEIERIRELNARRPDAFAIHFDKVYRAATPAFNLKPNAFLVEVAGKLRPGTALDVGRGGRGATPSGWPNRAGASPASTSRRKVSPSRVKTHATPAWRSRPYSLPTTNSTGAGSKGISPS